MNTTLSRHEALETYGKSHKRAASMAGGAILLLAVSAGVTFGAFHPQNLALIQGLTSATLPTLSSGLRTEILLWVVSLALDTAIAFGVYKYLSAFDKTTALLSGGLRLVYCVFLALGILQLSGFALGLNGSDDLQSLTTSGLAAFAQFQTFFYLGLVVFGGHLMVTGYALIRSEKLSSFLGASLLVAGLLYSVSSVLYQYSILPKGSSPLFDGITGAVMALSELALAFWLLYKGIKKEKLSH